MDPFVAFADILKEHIVDQVIEQLPHRWNESHRYYHNVNHLIDILQQIEKHALFDELNVYEKHVFAISSFFHDIIYDPKRNDNEDKSIEFFKSSHKPGEPYFIKQVCNLIECTKYRKRPTKKLEKIFWEADNAGFKSFEILNKNEQNIRKEYSYLSNKVYKENRIKFFESNLGVFESSIDKNIKKMINQVKKMY